MPGSIGLSFLSFLLLLWPGEACRQGDLTEVFQVASGDSWIRVRLLLPSGCRLLIDGPGVPPRLFLRDSDGRGNFTSEVVVMQLRRLPGYGRSDLLHTFWGLEAGRLYSVCLSRHTLLPVDDTEGSGWHQNPLVCSTAATDRGPGPTRKDGIAVLCLLGVYVLGLLLVATIFWRMHICLGPRHAELLAQQKFALRVATEATKRLRASSSMEI